MYFHTYLGHQEIGKPAKIVVGRLGRKEVVHMEAICDELRSGKKSILEFNIIFMFNPIPEGIHELHLQSRAFAGQTP